MRPGRRRETQPGAGRNDEAIAEAKRAVQLDPVSAETNFTLGSVLFFCRQYDKAIEQLRNTVELDPTYWVAHDYLGRAYEADGKLPEAIGEFQRALQLEKEAAENWSNLGHAYALSGKKEAALKVISNLQRFSYVRPYSIAAIYAALGDNDEAFVWLDHAYIQRSFYMTWLRVDPQLNNLRSDARFAELLKRMNLAS
jgi:tetratricopeptide (TPR) repeat protein